MLSPVSVMEAISSALRQRQGLQGARRDLLCEGQEGDFPFLLPFLKGMQIREAAAIRLPAPGQLLWRLFSSPWGFDEGKTCPTRCSTCGKEPVSKETGIFCMSSMWSEKEKGCEDRACPPPWLLLPSFPPSFPPRWARSVPSFPAVLGCLF